ncbi:7-carboxy-7-deazaguanine synthase QueE [Chitinivorax sp. B]|uniref:7-carboxy-7-deazaguanine synthase QueE n=1 Tax=Chitinivorax sp. B TaxID=2502235 RepID=UPI0010F8BBF2|nr:7-carboxy-7-deazaguanine synthase QueE [Chitinivorax sp. B]
MSTTQSIRITEIFYSLQGETSRVGLPTVFVRLTGCPLRCGYCDSEYAFHGGSGWTVNRILDEVQQYGTPYVCVTGGEPLAQKTCLTLLKRLCDEGYSVSLETSGALPINDVDPRVSRIVDVKTPGSGEVMKNHWPNIELLTPYDELKFVICHEADYEWAKQVLMEHQLHLRCPVLFSPVNGGVAPHELADWLLRDRLPVRYQLQLHKVLWGNIPGK